MGAGMAKRSLNPSSESKLGFRSSPREVRSSTETAKITRLLTASIAPQYYRGIPGTARAAVRRFIRQSRPHGWVTSDLSFDDSKSRVWPLVAVMSKENVERQVPEFKKVSCLP